MTEKTNIHVMSPELAELLALTIRLRIDRGTDIIEFESIAEVAERIKLIRAGSNITKAAGDAVQRAILQGHRFEATGLGGEWFINGLWTSYMPSKWNARGRVQLILGPTIRLGEILPVQGGWTIDLYWRDIMATKIVVCCPAMTHGAAPWRLKGG
jgi:hypothetical protein